MSELIREQAGEGRALPPVVEALRARYAQAEADLAAGADTTGGRALRPFEVRMPDRTSWRVGDGEPVFTVVLASERGHKALAAFDELAVAEAYMDGELDFEGEMLAVLKARPVLSDRHPLQYLWATYLQPLLLGQTGRDKKWIGSHYDVDPEFFLLWLDSRLRGYSHGFFERDDESLEDGMERKFCYAYDACGIRPGQRVLDIGGGWG